MNRALVLGVAVFLAVVGLAMVQGTSNQAQAGHCYGCYSHSGCHAVACHAPQACLGCHRRCFRRARCFRRFCHARRCHRRCHRCHGRLRCHGCHQCCGGHPAPAKKKAKPSDQAPPKKKAAPKKSARTPFSVHQVSFIR